MKFVKIIIIILLAQLSLSKAVGQGVDYFERGDIYQALRVAQKREKFLFVEFHAPWSYRSQWQNENLNKDTLLYRYINENFVSYKFDTQTVIGADFANKYSVTDYPCIFIFNTNGDVINRLTKAYDTNDLIEKLEKIQLSKQGSTLWRINQIETQLKQQQIAKAQHLTDILVGDLKTKILTKAYWGILSNITLNYYLSPAYQAVTNNIDMANSEFGEIEIKSLLGEIINNEIVVMLTNPKIYDSIKLELISADITKLGLTKPEFTLKMGMITDYQNSNISAYIKKCGELCNVVQEEQIFNTVLTLSVIADKATKEELKKARQIVTRQMRQIVIPTQTHSLTSLLKGLV